jgi:hypothetical protein
MTAQRDPLQELTAQQRLALSRQAWALVVTGPLWVALLRAGIRRCLKRQGLKRDQIR